MNEQNETPECLPGQFAWNELMTTDVAGAKSFYTRLLGWTTEAFGGGMEYTLLKKDDEMVGGLMKAPQPGMPAHWLAYVMVEDVDATAAQAAKLGGKICKEPFDVPDVGRIAIVMDPQGAAFGLFKPEA
jgi:hypothetical protein